MGIICIRIPRPVTHCNENLLVKLFRQKDILCGTPLPVPPGWTKMYWTSKKAGGAKRFMFVCLTYFVFVCLLSLFWVELQCMMWTSQNINKETVFVSCLQNCLFGVKSSTPSMTSFSKNHEVVHRSSFCSINKTTKHVCVTKDIENNRISNLSPTPKNREVKEKFHFWSCISVKKQKASSRQGKMRLGNRHKTNHMATQMHWKEQVSKG